MKSGLPVPGHDVMYIDTVTSYGPGMDQSYFDAGFDVGQQLGVLVVPQTVADEIRDVGEKLDTFDYTAAERRELRQEASSLATGAAMLHGLGMGYNIAVPDERYRPGDIVELPELDEFHVEDVFGISELG